MVTANTNYEQMQMKIFDSDWLKEGNLYNIYIYRRFLMISDNNYMGRKGSSEWRDVIKRGFIPVYEIML